ncbi:hypothetical protein AUP68_09001 [Ilyonectria robusta]
MNLLMDKATKEENAYSDAWLSIFHPLGMTRPMRPASYRDAADKESRCAPSNPGPVHATECCVGRSATERSARCQSANCVTAGHDASSGTRGQQQMNRRMLAYSNGGVAGVSRSAGDVRASAPAAVPTPVSLPTQVDAVPQSARGMVTVTVRSSEAQVTFWSDVRGQRAQQDGAHGQQS